ACLAMLGGRFLQERHPLFASDSAYLASYVQSMNGRRIALRAQKIGRVSLRTVVAFPYLPASD
ncbi:MAG: hypothetical protein ACHREM_24400, partial [Polyangiales bacterium]